VCIFLLTQPDLTMDLRHHLQCVCNVSDPDTVAQEFGKQVLSWSTQDFVNKRVPAIMRPVSNPHPVLVALVGTKLWSMPDPPMYDFFDDMRHFEPTVVMAFLHPTPQLWAPPAALERLCAQLPPLPHWFVDKLHQQQQPLSAVLGVPLDDLIALESLPHWTT
jgi:hypothetical protein